MAISVGRCRQDRMSLWSRSEMLFYSYVACRPTPATAYLSPITETCAQECVVSGPAGTRLFAVDARTDWLGVRLAKQDGHSSGCKATAIASHHLAYLGVKAFVHCFLRGEL